MRTETDLNIGFVPPNQNYNQSLVGRLTDPVSASFYVKTAVGNLKISKTSEDEIIKNIPFTVKGNGKTYNVKTDANGNAESYLFSSVSMLMKTLRQQTEKQFQRML